ncbi:alpha/beta fold hydrolase [Citricoccus nitrophenolicus]|uniref:Alpha/beta fold hydrolase n=1 Tax=Citricoccus nitrophenolicus TaxID=863575 RepID=A0ABV0IN50_9MICC
MREMAGLPSALWKYTNIQLTTASGPTGRPPSTATAAPGAGTRRRHPVPVLLTFALINRPDIFDLRPGNSFVEFLLDEGYDVFLVDWGYADEEDAETGLDDFALEHIPRAVREVRRASGAEEITLIGWCIGAVLTGMYLSVTLDAPVRNWIPLTMPFDAANTTCESLLGNDEVDTDWLGQYGAFLPGSYVDTVNKLLKPAPNYVGTPLRLFRQVQDGTADRSSYQPMARWVADTPNFPMRAFRQWVTWVYKENRLARGRVRLRGQKVDFAASRQSILVVTADSAGPFGVAAPRLRTPE